ncbi:MAG: hypothetical protein HY887_09625 [Deltaproteobacteria bacterium]|nr:hypothetical protein [Deltaproteobacteria bacterium]
MALMMKALKKILSAVILTAPFIGMPAQAKEDAMVSLSLRIELPPQALGIRAWGRDPFIPLAGKTGMEPGLKLTAIFYNTEKPSAIVNGSIVYAGSAVAGQKVIDIGRTHVILQGEKGPVRLDISGLVEIKDAIGK